jgi:hypothetical protein
MKNKILLSALFVGLFLTFTSCSNDVPNTEPYLIVKFKFDPNQARLNNLGQPSTIPSTNRAQTPIFNTISAHYFELAPTAFTALGSGAVLYHAPETNIDAGVTAIDFRQAKIVAEGETFLKIPLKQLAAGTYQYVRVSLSYQNYQISVRTAGADYTGTLASFVGYKTYITTHTIGNTSFPVNANKVQGYWAFALNNYPYSSSGDGAGVTTVPNPLFATSPIPAGSCVVTGKFANDLVISGKEENDVTLTLSLSINNSFEWKENTAIPDNKFEPGTVPTGDVVVDMGLRGLIPSFVK